VLLVEFSQLTGEEDHGKILAVLEKHNWNLEAAVSAFLDEQDSKYYYQPVYKNVTSTSPYHTSTTTYNRDGDQFTTSMRSDDYEYTSIDNNDNHTCDDDASNLQPRAMPKIDYDENEINDDESTYTRQDVSENIDDQSYLKSYGFPTLNPNQNDNYYEPTTSTSTTKYDQNDYVAFKDTIDDNIENRTTYDNNNNNNNNNNRNKYSTPLLENNEGTIENNEGTLRNNEGTLDTVSDLGFNSKYFCKLAVPGSGWEAKPTIARGRTSLKLLCVDQLTGKIITHEQLIDLLALSEFIDCYAFEQLVFGTASRYYFTLRQLPTFKKLSGTTLAKIESFMTDSWDD